MIRTYGSQPKAPPPGYFKEIIFPVLALTDTLTGDGRMLDGEGGDTRDLPLTIKMQLATSFGHQGALTAGALFEVAFDPEAKTLSGKGWLLADDVGRKTAFLFATKAQDKNSVDLAEVKARYEEDLDTGEYWVRFTKWKLAATTGVATPAFAAAYGEVEWSDELMASLGEGPIVVDEGGPLDFNIDISGMEIEVVASGAIKFPYEHFYTPEAAMPTKAVVTEDGRVYGHLALWESCHDGFEGQCVRVPRPTDGYSSFNKPGPLTERGQVQTDPIFAFGGHRPSKSAPTIEEAYGGIENAWADVRVVEGVFGPWISGRVRPGITEELSHAARCSRLSGHWVGGRLKAIVSVNSEGFDVPGASDAELDLVAGFAFSLDDDGVGELVASFPPCLAPPIAAVAPVTAGTGTLTNASITVLQPGGMLSANLLDTLRDALGLPPRDKPVDLASQQARQAALLRLLNEED